MFKKVLVVDDHGVVNQGVLKVLNVMGIDNVHKAQYCDKAALKIKKAILDKQPFDLLITDLSFKKDHRDCTLNSGEELIAALREMGTEIQIIVHSMDDRLQKVRSLVQKLNIDAFVCKGRNGASELQQAIACIAHKKRFLSPQVANALNAKIEMEIDDYDIELIKQLSLGFSQADISNEFQKSNITPHSLSSIEKKINKLKDLFKANNAVHLVAIMKDLGLI
tara:strand:+ start:26633 stop:27298 length:666 start_codon:yes stop_codon:yes gene_type:complete